MNVGCRRGDGGSGTTRNGVDAGLYAPEAGVDEGIAKA